MSELDHESGLLGIARMRLLQEREGQYAIIDGTHIREILGRLADTGLFPGVDAESIERVARRLEEEVVVDVGRPDIVDSRDWTPWLDAARARIAPYYWDRYRHLLVTRGLPPNVVARLSEVTDQILDRLHDPMDTDAWDRRGLVMGHVQSGKTANYIGLIAKAADAGFKVIIVIAGVHNNLRNQTQDRVDEGFIGFSRTGPQANGLGSLQPVGVGLIDAARRPSHFTSSRRDFSRAAAQALGVQFKALNEPAVFVIKKNATTLQNLIDWLKDHNKQESQARIEAPLLLVDDEADNASINVAPQPDQVARINGQIREVLSLFSHSAYVAYTATPFANIFIDPDVQGTLEGNEDLFPRSFIVSLDTPTDYIGPTRIFLDDDDALLVDVEDFDEYLPLKHKIHYRVQALPPSLVDAMRAFVLARAVRILRGQAHQHSSMLVNASRFVRVQSQLRDLIQLELDRVRDAVRVHAALPPDLALEDAELAALKGTWEAVYGDVDISWQSIQEVLLEAAAPISVVAINSESSNALDYEAYKATGRHAIVVGGLALSRGLTLEGLCTTYFLRNSVMYDTLLQMGRWFGYRPGYEDLIRIWMPSEAKTWYSFIAEAVEELRSELRKMTRIGATPADFGLKVRRHPAALMVTARNKMRSAEPIKVEVGLSEQLVETAQLIVAHQEHNRDHLKRTLESLASAPSLGASTTRVGTYYRDLPVDFVLDFLRGFRSAPLLTAADPELVGAYIQSRQHEVLSWDVLVRSKQPSPLVLPFNGGSVGCIERTVTEGDMGAILMNKHRLGDISDEMQGLTSEQVDRAKMAFAQDNPEGEGKRVPGKYYRRQRERPLLILYSVACSLSSEAPVGQPGEAWAAWAISFPPTQLPQSHVEYLVNPVWVQEHFGGFDEDGDDRDEEGE